VNDPFRKQRSRNKPYARRWLGAAVFGLPLPATVLAETHFVPYVGTQFEYNSNVFSLSSPEQAVTANGDSDRSDTIKRYMAGATASYLWGRQQIDAAIDGSIFDYTRFDKLDHKEYGLDGGYSWKLLDNMDGSLHYKQTGTMTPFADVGGTQFELQTQHTGDGTFNINVLPEWRLETGADITQTKSPRIGAPNYEARDTSGRLATLYLGFSGITAGIRAQYDFNQFRGADTAAQGAEPQYHQETIDLTLNSKIDGLSNFASDFGYTQRRSDGPTADTVSGVNGNLEYVRMFSVKTRFEINLYRRVTATNVAGSFTSIDTGFSTSLTWLPTPKITTSVIYTFENDKFQSLNDPTIASTPDRKDSFQDTRGTLDYQILRWLIINTYVEYQDRQSNFEIDGYNTIITGIGLRATFN